MDNGVIWSVADERTPEIKKTATSTDPLVFRKNISIRIPPCFPGQCKQLKINRFSAVQAPPRLINLNRLFHKGPHTKTGRVKNKTQRQKHTGLSKTVM
jgi:hypothetical protein